MSLGACFCLEYWAHYDVVCRYNSKPFTRTHLVDLTLDSLYISLLSARVVSQIGSRKIFL